MKKNSWCSILIVLRGGLPIYCLPQIFNKSLSLAGLHSSFVYCQLQLRVRVGPLGAVTLSHYHTLQHHTARCWSFVRERDWETQTWTINKLQQPQPATLSALLPTTVLQRRCVMFWYWPKWRQTGTAGILKFYWSTPPLPPLSAPSLPGADGTHAVLSAQFLPSTVSVVTQNGELWTRSCI